MRHAIAALVAGTLLSVTSAAGQSPSNTARDRAMPHYHTGMEHLRTEAWPESVKAFRQATEIDPSFEMAFYGLGRAQMAQKQFAQAVAAYQNCRALYIAQAGQQFSNQQDAQRYRRDQMTEIDEVIRSYQQGRQSMQTAQVVRQLQERRQQLQHSLDRGANLSIDASVPAFVSLALGSAHFRLQQFADAEREFKATIAADAKTGEAHNNLAVVYLLTGRFEEAEKAVKAAEKTGFRVNPMLKDDIAAAKKKK